MKTKLLLTALVAITVSTPTLAAVTAVFGAPDCGTWVKARNEPNKAWVLGFLSGLNGNEKFQNVLDKVASADQIFLWMDNYCKANPLKTTINGSTQLMYELQGQK